MSGFSFLVVSMNLLITIIYILLFLALFMLFAGLVRPWWVLWFLDYQNRIRVLQIYGGAAILLTAIAYVLRFTLSL
ncbi:hypothetical protein AB9P05_07790 [Roseivirga sp. BDSF3-8]|uniref:hypothetical protein n=1 Tax=Roseivirga sp. BDSF3-8 TaxID=3241598 RepID=UPI003531FA58